MASHAEPTIPRPRDPFTSPPGYVSFDEATDENGMMWFDPLAGDFVNVAEERRRLEYERFRYQVRHALEFTGLYWLDQGRDTCDVLEATIARLQELANFPAGCSS